MKRIFVIILACILSIGFACGCSCSGEPEEEQPSAKIEETDYDLVKDGTSDYKIVLAEETEYDERFAAEEIAEFFYRSTKLTLLTVTENAVTYSADSKLIILGKTKFTENSGINTTILTTQSFTVKTVDSNVFIVGGDAYGTLWGAYEFLAQQLNYECYTPDEISVAKDVKDMKLYKIETTQSPDVLWRQPAYGFMQGEITAKRYRMVNQPWIKENGNYIHNGFSEYLNPDKYAEEHPDWYTETKDQFCYNAHGNAEELKAMQDAVVARMKELISKFFDRGEYRSLISITQEDTGTWCTCEACAAKKEQYKANSASVVQFLNPVAREIKAWLSETYPNREVLISFFAYHATEDAPVKTVNGVLAPIDDSVVCEDNLAVLYAPFNAQYSYGFKTEKNTTYLDTMKKWNTICKHIFFWPYDTNFTTYFAWHDTFNSLPELYEVMKEYGVSYIFNQGQHNVTVHTGFHFLKGYLNAKLAWDVDADYNALIDGFFTNYFKSAAEPMREYFESFRSWMQYLRDYENMPGQINYTWKKDYVPKRVLDKWNGYIEQAYEAIKPLKSTDLEQYNTLYDRIQTESMAIRCWLIEFYGTSYDDDVLKEMQKSFKADADRLGFTRYSSDLTISEVLWTKWGLE